MLGSCPGSKFGGILCGTFELKTKSQLCSVPGIAVHGSAEPGDAASTGEWTHETVGKLDFPELGVCIDRTCMVDGASWIIQ